MKNVLLVNPNTEKAPYPVVPLGLCLLASRIERDFSVQIYDGTFQGGGALEPVIASLRPDYIGVGIRNIDDVVMGRPVSYLEDIERDFMATIRRASRAPRILGGAGFSLFPMALLDRFEADFGIVGPAEEALPELLGALESGRDPSGIPGVAVRSRGMLTPPRIPRDETLQIPCSTADRFLDFGPYRSKGSYPIQTKRGCAHRCLYCSYPLIEGARYRLREPSAVVDEIAEASDRLGDVTFEIVDSTLNAPEGHIEAICREIVRRKLQVRLRAMGVNPGAVTGPLLEAMKAAGFAQIDCSADTASTVMLLALRKGYTREQLAQTARLLKAFDLPTMWFFLFGGPGETPDTIAESLDFIDRFIDPLDMVHMTEGLRIYPGTGLFEIAQADGQIARTDSMLDPHFYVSRALGPERLSGALIEASSRRPNCIRAIESTPDPEMVAEAAALRQEQRVTEPMFRTLLRVRKKRLAGA